MTPSWTEGGVAESELIFSEGCETKLNFIVLREHPSLLNVIEWLHQSTIPTMLVLRGSGFEEMR